MEASFHNNKDTFFQRKYVNLISLHLLTLSRFFDEDYRLRANFFQSLLKDDVKFNNFVLINVYNAGIRFSWPNMPATVLILTMNLPAVLLYVQELPILYSKLGNYFFAATAALRTTRGSLSVCLF